MVPPWDPVIAAVAGYIVGWVTAYLTEWLEGDEKVAIGGRSALVGDPAVQIGSAVAWAALAITAGGAWPKWLEGGLIASPLVQVAVTDFRTRYVYTVMAGVGLAIGLAFGGQVHGAGFLAIALGPIVGGLTASVLGALAGGLAFGALYLIGKMLYRGIEPMARGDITIAAMVGAGAAACAPQALVLGIIASGVLALGVWVLSRSRRVFMPYGPGLCLGGLATLFLC